MKINKDLAEALLMLSLIILVLVVTTDFESLMTKNLIITGLGILAVISGIFRVLGAKQEGKKEE